jgi:hypothetical protein
VIEADIHLIVEAIGAQRSNGVDRLLRKASATGRK